MVAGDSKVQPVSAKSRLMECYKRGMLLASRDKNYDYAHAMFVECVSNDPGNVLFVEAMARNLREWKPRVRKWKMPRWGDRSLKKAIQQRDWPEAVRRGIELLKENPWDVTTLRTVAQTCAELHHNEVELVYLKQALDAEPKNVEVNRHCARSLGRMGQFDQAIACWHRVESLQGKDGEAAKMISQLAEEKLKYPGGRPPAVPPAPPKKTPVPASETDRRAPAAAPTPRQLLERAIVDEPHNASAHLQLANLLVESGQYEAAEAIIGCAISRCGEHPDLKQLLSRVHQLQAELQETLATSPAFVATRSIRVPWLELALALAGVGLLLQISPTAAAAAWRVLDVRQWPRAAWLWSNVVIMIALIALRFAPEFITAWRQRRGRRPISPRR